MKKLITLLLAAALVLSLAACGGGESTSGNSTSTPSGNEEHTHTEEVIPAVEATCTTEGRTEGKRCSECGEILVAQETVPALGHTTETGTCERCGQSFGAWYTNYYVDNFNQPVPDQWFITENEYLVGTFSNSATTNSLLNANVVVDFEKDITIFLYEYGRSQVKNSSENYVDEYDITMRTPDGTDHNMTGTMYCGDDRIFIDDGYIDEVLTALNGDGDIMFHIVNAERTVENYLITVATSNFADEYAAATGN